MADKKDISSIESNKYNHWCERRVLDRKAEMRDWTTKLLLRKDLSQFEKDALYFHEITGCNGFEFVAFSNTRNDAPVIFKNGFILMPCFLSNNELDGRNQEDHILELTFRMMFQERFIYDGWMPLEIWDEKSVRKAVQYVDEVLSIFSLDANAFWEWGPKYSSVYIPSRHRSWEDLSNGQFEQLVQAIDLLNEFDKKAIYRSLSWLNKSHLSNEPTVRFLSAFIAIESLANYIISEDCDDRSSLAEFRIEKLKNSERRKKREKCIEEILSQKYKTNPTDAVKEANDICVYGVKKKIKSNLSKVFASESYYADLLFKKDSFGKSLWDLRNDIAHGELNTLSDAEVNRIKLAMWDVEKLARNYIKIIISKINIKSTSNIFDQNNSVQPYSNKEIDIDVHMAYIYSCYHSVRGSEDQLQ